MSISTIDSIADMNQLCQLINSVISSLVNKALPFFRNLYSGLQTNDLSNELNESEMHRIRQKHIARILIMLMLMTPLTGMAMQWSAQSTETNHSDMMQMFQHEDEQLVQINCEMESDCQGMCNTTQQCSSTSISLLSGFTPTIFPVADGSHFRSTQSLRFSLVLSELYRPPRA